MNVEVAAAWIVMHLQNHYRILSGSNWNANYLPPSASLNNNLYKIEYNLCHDYVSSLAWTH